MSDTPMTPPTFESWLQAKGIACMSDLHPNELRQWKASYDVEVKKSPAPEAPATIKAVPA